VVEVLRWYRSWKWINRIVEEYTATMLTIIIIIYKMNLFLDNSLGISTRTFK
jgi:hypothetical protein